MGVGADGGQQGLWVDGEFVTPAEVVAMRSLIAEMRALVADAVGGAEKAPAADSPYLTAKQAAAYLNVSYGTFRHRAKNIKRTRTGHYRREDLDHFAAHRRRSSPGLRRGL